MQFLQTLLPNTRLLQLESYEIEADSSTLTLNLRSSQTAAQCPLCKVLSRKVHSHYQRTLADLPCMHLGLKLSIQVSKFFCSNPECLRQVFTERLPDIAAPWARKTVRFIERLQSIGLALGGAAGARLGSLLGYASSGSTLLTHVKRLLQATVETPKILGVDDFAFRKGHNYGTIVVDLETHQPIELLPDRKAETLTTWLQEHPGVRVLSRDRSKVYRSAMNEAAPNAIQVADRFHLVKNLSGYLEQVLSRYRSELKAAEQAYHQQLVAALPEETVVAVPQPTTAEAAHQRVLANQRQRIQHQRRIKSLRAQGWPNTAIAQEVGVSLRTVDRYRAAPDFPETPVRGPALGRSILNAYKQQLLDWWNQGIQKPLVLFRLLRQKGYEGSARTVQRYVKSLRKAQGLPPLVKKAPDSLPKVIDPQTPPLTPKRAAYLIIVRPENRKEKDKELLEKTIQQHPDLALMVELADAFLELLRKQQANKLDIWIDRIFASPLKPLHSFAQGLLDDYAAVKASLMMAVSNGPVEGLNNKLKMLKRQMYGRAGLDLLAKRFIMG